MSKQTERSVFDALRGLVIAAIAVFGFAGHAAAQATNLVANGGFEAPVISGSFTTFNVGTGLTNPPTWVISGASINGYRSTSGAPEGKQWIDLTGQSGSTISQSLATSPGGLYRLSFKYSTQIGSTPAVTVKWGPGPSGSPTVTKTFTISADKGWVTVTLDPPLTATTATTLLSFTSAGGNKNYGVQLDAVSVTSLTTNQQTLTITGPGSLTYTNPAAGTAITTTGGSGSGAVTFSAAAVPGTTLGCAVSGTQVSVTNASGTCVLTATKAADVNFNAATSAPFTVALVKANQAALSVTGPASVTYGATGTAAATAASSSVASTFSASGSGCSVTGTTVSVTNASGTCSLTATNAGDNNYNSATSASFAVTLNKAPQNTLTVAGPASLAYGASALATTSGGSAAGAVTFSVSPTSGTSLGCALSGNQLSVIDASGTCLLAATMAGNDNYNDATSAAVAVTLPTPFAAPTLVRVVATASGGGAYLLGRVDGASNLDVTLQVFSAAHCTAGALDPAPTGPVGAVTLTTDKDGYFYTAAPVSPVDYNSFVAVRVTAPSATQRSACLVSSADNETWPNARLLTLPLSGSTLPGDFIDVPGKSRWYKFAVTPGQRIQVSLSGLPADYDLAVFKDIRAAFLTEVAPVDTANPNAALTKLSAEFAPSAFSPSAFSPSAFSPSAFSPDAYSPSAFSPSAFSADVYSPSAFSPSAFSPSAFSPSAFSPSAFSPSAFSPSAFSPSAFSGFAPPGIDPGELAVAFSSAQTRSIIAVSATPGTIEESAVVNSWNNTGYFYVRVAGRAGVSSTESAFTLNVTSSAPTCTGVAPLAPFTRPAGAGGVTTIILTDLSRVRNQANALLSDAERTALLSKLSSIGTVVDVNVDDRIGNPTTGLRRQADDNPSCPYAKNLLADEIKSIVDSYRANNPRTPTNPGLRYVVIAGNDDVIPFFRYPDQSLLGPESGYVPPVTGASDASLRLDYTLSQDAYGSGTQISLRASNFPVPGLAVGRLVETSADMAGLIDAYLAAPVVSPRSSLVTGYDFLTDAANAVSGQLVAGIGATTAPMDTLITPNTVSPQGPKPGSLDPPPWTASDLRSKLLGPRHDVIFLAGHFSANSALAADFTTSLITTELAASTTDFTNSIVFSAGCHSGYNIVDRDAIPGVTLPLDWAQAFARKKATLIAGTGYQYGDTDFIEYSERLYLNFARQLRAAGSGPVSVGEALVKAKLDYLAATPDIRGIHEKALLEATLFGLPMLGVDMPGRLTAPGAGDAIAADAVGSGAAATLGLGLKTALLELASADLQVTSNDPRPLTRLGGGADIPATWLSGPLPDRLVVSNPAEPVLPLIVKNVTPAAAATDVLRGVGFRGGSYTDSPAVFPLTGAATTDLRAAHGPFVSPFFFPMRTWSVNYFGALAGTGGTSLLVTPIQHRAEDIALGTSTRRQFTALNLRLYYSSNRARSSLADGPSIVRVDAQRAGGSVVFTAQVVGDPAVGVQEVWITYTDKPAGASSGTWIPWDLKQCVAPLVPECGGVEDSRLWKRTLASASPADILYGVQAVNGSGVVTQDDNFGAYYRVAGAAPAASTLALVSGVPASARFGDSPAIKVALSSGSTSLVGKGVIVAIDGKARAGTIGSDGSVTINVPIASLPGSYRVVASFLGDDLYLPSSASSATFPVSKATASLATLTSTFQTKLTTNGVDQPLIQEAVRFDVFSATPGDPCTIPPPTESPVNTFYAITDYLGRAQLPATGLDLAAGSYKVRASFAGNATYECASTAARELPISAETPVFAPPNALPDTLIVGDSRNFTVSSASGQQAVTVSLLPESGAFCTLSGASPYTLSATATGTCTLVITAGGTTTYSSLHTQMPINIRLAQALTFTAPTSLTYLQTSGSLPAATNSPASIPITWTAPGTAGGVCDIVDEGGGKKLKALSGTGSCQLTAKALGDSVYADFNASFPVTLTQATGQFATPLTVTGSTVFVPGTPPAGTFAVSTTALGGQITFSLGAASSTSICAVGATTASDTSPVSASKIYTASVTMMAAGDCWIKAQQAPDLNYTPAWSVTQKVTIAGAPQYIDFPTIGDKTLQARTITLSATARSGPLPSSPATNQPVNFVVSGSCALNGGTVAPATLTLTATGSCAVTAKAAAGGNFATAADVAQTFNIDLANVWTLLPNRMAKPRLGHTATRFESGPLAGWVLIAGGVDRTGTSLQTSELYNPATRTFVAAANSMIAKSVDHAAALLLTGKVIVLGGGSSSAQMFDPATRTWSSAGTPLSTLKPNRVNHTATRLPDGSVLFIGGADSSGNTLASTILYTPSTGAFAAGPVLDAARESHTATLLPDGKVLVVGGRYKSSFSYTSRPTYQICTATACTASTGDIGKRHAHAAVALGPDGSKVLVAGGVNGTTEVATVALFTYNATTGTGTWATTGLGSLASARSDLTLSELPNGRALAAGGTNGNSLKTADVYQPPFGPVAPMNIVRAGHTATVLKDSAGNFMGILVVGGADSDSDADDALDSAELYGTL